MGHLHDVRTELRDMLRAGDLRATTPRLAVLVVLHERKAPMTHDQIMEALPDGGFDKASVWRLLSDLSDRGILRRMDLGDRVWRFELLDSCRDVQPNHAHFLCDACGTVQCLPPLELRPTSGPLPKVLRGVHLTLQVTGTCGDCA